MVAILFSRGCMGFAVGLTMPSAQVSQFTQLFISIVLIFLYTFGSSAKRLKQLGIYHVFAWSIIIDCSISAVQCLLRIVVVVDVVGKKFKIEA